MNRRTATNLARARTLASASAAVALMMAGAFTLTTLVLAAVLRPVLGAWTVPTAMGGAAVALAGVAAVGFHRVAAATAHADTAALVHRCDPPTPAPGTRWACLVCGTTYLAVKVWVPTYRRGQWKITQAAAWAPVPPLSASVWTRARARVRRGQQDPPNGS